MDARIIKMVILQEKLNELCNESVSFKSFNINMFQQKIKSANFFDNDLMDILFANYYVKNKNNINDYNLNNVVKYISNYASNKNVLYNCFMNNNDFASIISNDYLMSYYDEVDVNRYYSNCNSYEKSIVNKLSLIFNYVGFNYLTFLARVTILKNAVDNIEEMSMYELINYSYLVNDAHVLRSILLGDSYTYMNLYNNSNCFGNYINILEKNSGDINKLWQELINIKKCLYSFTIFTSNLYLCDDSYSDLYKYISSQNSNFMTTLKNLNPFYILDEIEDFNRKKYLIK